MTRIKCDFERAKEFVSKIASGTSQEMDYYANILVEFANETTKELEKEVQDFKETNHELAELCILRKKRIADLEKENAELKEKLEHRNCVDCSNHGSNIKLLKAKGFIKRLIDTLEAIDGEQVRGLKVVKEVEQFINSEVQE